MKALSIMAGLGLLLALTGCRVVRSTVKLPGKTVSAVSGAGKTNSPAADPVEVQQTLLRFAGELSAGVTVGVDKLRRGTNTLDPGETLRWNIGLESQICSIASGPNAFANLLDLTVFVTVVRAAVEEQWRPRVFGESARPLLESCRAAETNLWLLCGKVLSAAQQAELRTAIRNWQRQNPEPESVLAGRAAGFATQEAGANKSEAAKPGSVFNLLMLDPFAGVDPAVREIAQSRLFAERALYVTQKMPTLLRWSTELLTLNATRLPAVQQLVTNSTQLASSLESFGRVADQLPQLVNDQRRAAIQQLFDGLATERTNWIASLAADELKLRGTLLDLRQTLNAGTALTKSSDELVHSVDKFLTRFDKETNAPAAVTTTNGRRFDILDYATTAREVTSTMKELNATINSLDKAVPQIQKAGEELQAAGNHLLNRLFFLGASLIAILLVGSLITRLIYRRLAGKTSSAIIVPPTKAPPTHG